MGSGGGERELRRARRWLLREWQRCFPSSTPSPLRSAEGCSEHRLSFGAFILLQEEPVVFGPSYLAIPRLDSSEVGFYTLLSGFWLLVSDEPGQYYLSWPGTESALVGSFHTRLLVRKSLPRHSGIRINDELSKRKKMENHRNYHNLCSQLNECFLVAWAVKGNYIPVLVYQQPICTLSSSRLFLKAEPETKVETYSVWKCGPREQGWDKGGNRWKRKECPSKKGSVSEWSTSVLGYLVQNLPSILIKLCLRIVCLRDEKKKHLSVSWYHLCAEGCSHGAATPPRGETHWATASHALQQRRFRTRS